MINAVSHKNFSQLTLFKIIVLNVSRDRIMLRSLRMRIYGIYINIVRRIKGIICLI